jgi:hypothetical protein
VQNSEKLEKRESESDLDEISRVHKIWTLKTNPSSFSQENLLQKPVKIQKTWIFDEDSAFSIILELIWGYLKPDIGNSEKTVPFLDHKLLNCRNVPSDLFKLKFAEKTDKISNYPFLKLGSMGTKTQKFIRPT